MKILKLRFKNLNSLYGRWEIDFTVPEYESGGIFAITGPTGSGKTTILDALSIALYGETPRLGKISQSANETMSRLSSDCFAEVEFESAKGSFCCSFSQKKSGNIPGGKLQGPKHEISDLKTGKIIEEKKSKVPLVVEEVTGMNYDRFKRSIMLAQGDFAVFLNSRPADRAPVLEQITGTEIYTEISVKVHERRKYEQNILDGMEESLRAINILSDEEESELKERLCSLEKESSLVKAKLEETERFIRWIENISRIEADIGRLNDERERISLLRDNSSEDLERLEVFRRASHFKNIYDNLLQSRARLYDESKAFDELSAVLPELQKRYQLSVAEYESALRQRDGASRNFNDSLEVIKKTREYDIRINGCLKSISSALKSLEEMKDKKESYKENISRISGNILCLESEAEKLRQYLSGNERLKKLRDNIALIEEKAKRYSAFLRDGEALALKLEKSQNDISEREEDISGRQKTLAEIKGSISESRVKTEELSEKTESLLGGRKIGDFYGLDREYSGLSIYLKDALRYSDEIKAADDKLSSLGAEVEKDSSELIKLKDKYSDLSGRKVEKAEFIRVLEENYALASKIKSLDEERKRLVPGKPCPLCGSAEHPYAEEAPVSDKMKPEIEAEKLLLDEITSQISGIFSAIAVLESKIKADKKRSEELMSGTKELNAKLSVCLDNAGMNPEESGRDEILEKIACYDGELAKVRAVLRDYEPLYNELRESEEMLSGLSERSAAAESDLRDAEFLLKEAISAEERISGDLVKIRDEAGVLMALLENEFLSYSPGDELPEERGEIPVILRDILSVYSTKEREYAGCEEKLAICRSDLDKYSALLSEAEERIQHSSGEAGKLESELDILKSQRFKLFGDKNPDDEEGRLKNLADLAEALLVEVREKKENLYSEVIRLESRAEGLEKTISSLKYDTAVLSESFLSKIRNSGFESEATFEEALMPESDAERIAAVEEEIKTGETRVTNLLSEQSGILAAEREKRLTEMPEGELRDVYTAFTERQRETDRSTGEVSVRLKTNDEQKGLASGKLKEIEEQKKVLLRWGKLNELIGSHNGSKFQRFAQGLTFEILVSHANSQLRKMSDRYILVRSDSDPLELGIVDNYQAGEVRSTKNLSGGESFIVSLALALGLSDMSGSRVRVDSLFLDEGFGTLDENALDIALDTLSGLQHEGKTIGVISHVPALKERISTRIRVQRKSSGRSVINGPGCREMA
ncbi:AAA family ATPase [Methanoplanus limicola]|uniref:SMC domain protein n=1 Tax=Methanoplanus limicola DSM 2279 TaxID=937775 RepID=H1Z2E7_9EURY|nr:AAA family ATPase [Methanoplanus limicola]EHQ35473.1 SMC domain protein [Methanoplanus limicola DSM 2279]